jgi:uncharacterized protein
MLLRQLAAREKHSANESCCQKRVKSVLAHLKTRMKRYLRDKLPRPESITGNKYLKWLAPWLGHPRLWHLHRRGVAMGVAIGLVTGLIPGPIQILLAVLIAIPLRANVLAAAFATFYTNPLTFIPLYILAYTMGTFVTGEKIRDIAPPDFTFSLTHFWTIVPDMFNWFVSLGPTLLIGLAIQCTLFAIAGYIGTMVIWRCVVSRMWKNRQVRHAQTP